jgi:flagella basal body P-ring formation protein FlgA
MMHALALAASFLAAEASPGAAAIIEMKQDAHVEGNIIRLADIARVESAEPEEQQALEQVYVTLAPAPGQAKTVALDEVRSRLRTQGVNLGRVIIEGALCTTVRRRGTPVPTADQDAAQVGAAQVSPLADLVAAFVAGALNRAAQDVQVEFDAATARRLERLATSPLRFAVTNGSAAPIGLGPNNLVLLGYHMSEVRERLTAKVVVSAYCPVPVAARAIARQQTLAAGDVTVERRQVSDPDVAALKAADLIGRRAERPIPQGAAIEPAMVADVPLVRRGDVVTVIARAPNIQVKTLGVALDDGALHGAVKVRNVDTQKVIPATVEGPRTVALDVALTRREGRP